MSLIDDHKTVATRSSWCDLAITIIEMERDIKEMKPYLKKAELKSFEKILKIYETEKAKRVAELPQSTDYARFLFG